MGVCTACGWAQTGSPVPPTFFAMSALPVTDFPKVSIGALAHPGFAWETIEQSRGVFNFQAFDTYVAGAVAHGLVDPATNTVNMSITLGLTPSWAVADQSTCSSPNNLVQCTAPPDNIQDWKDFLTALIQHYNGVIKPHIRYYELWNEFNDTIWWSGTHAQMVALAQAAYPIIHQDPVSALLTPSVAGPVGTVKSNSAVNWMTAYLQAGGSKYADGGAFHGYLAQNSATNAEALVVPFPMPEQDSTSGCTAFVECFGSVVTKATQMRAVFDQNGLAGKPMYQTEGSWGNGNITDPDTQVAWLARWNLLWAGMRSTVNLPMAAWFSWGPSETWGTIETPAGQPTAAAAAYTQIYNWVVGATIGQPCASASNGTWSCTLTRPGGYGALAVWNTQGSISYTPAATYVEYRDLAGNTTAIAKGAAVTIGAEPILLESGPQTLVTLVANAEGEGATIAPNTWVEVKGTNLAPGGDTRIWQGSDFVNDRMPTQLDGVSVTVNGKSAYIYYISPGQVNILTPPDAMEGAVEAIVSNGASASTPVAAQAQTLAPSWFVFNGGIYVAAVHANGGLIGPASLYPGSTTPAKPGETVALYANGFGQTSTPIVSGSRCSREPCRRFQWSKSAGSLPRSSSPGWFSRVNFSST
ncbi:MAG: hypothetical protein ACLQU1_35900 [Bryobacteraceae bacterium]